MYIFLSYFAIFLLGLQFAYAAEEVKEGMGWSVLLRGVKEENKDECYKVWHKAKKMQNRAKERGVKMHPDYAEKKVYEKAQTYRCRDAEQDWLQQFFNKLQLIEDEDEMKRAISTPIEDDDILQIKKEETAAKESNDVAAIELGKTHKEQLEYKLKLIARLNTKLNHPLSSLFNEKDEKMLYATVVFIMQPAISSLIPDEHRRMNDHAGLVLEWYDEQEGVWKTGMLHYHNIQNGGSSGGGVQHIVSVKDKYDTYSSVIWDSDVIWDLYKESKENNVHVWKRDQEVKNDQRYVNYFRYATFSFSKKGNAGFLAKIEEAECPLEPLEYSMRGVKGYDNCHTYLVRTLEHLARSSSTEILSPNWPYVHFGHAHYKYKLFCPWFTADDFRRLIRTAANGNSQIKIMDQTYDVNMRDQNGNLTLNTKSVLDEYEGLYEKPRTFRSYSTLHSLYFQNRNNLLEIWQNRKSGCRGSYAWEEKASSRSIPTIESQNDSSDRFGSSGYEITFSDDLDRNSSSGFGGSLLQTHKLPRTPSKAINIPTQESPKVVRREMKEKLNQNNSNMSAIIKGSLKIEPSEIHIIEKPGSELYNSLNSTRGKKYYGDPGEHKYSGKPLEYNRNSPIQKQKVSFSITPEGVKRFYNLNQYR